MNQRKSWTIAVGVLLVTGLLSAGGVAAFRLAQAEHRRQMVSVPEQAAAEVRVAPVQVRLAGYEVRTRGFLTPYETLRVAAEISGRVERQNVEVSDVVESGDALFELDRALLLVRQRKAMAEKQRADSSLKQARFNAQRVKELKRQDSANPIEILDVETVLEQALALQKEAQAALDGIAIELEKSVVRSPTNGVVARVYTRQGEFARAGQPMADLIVVDRLKLTVQLSDREIVGCVPGDSVAMEAVALPGQRFSGRILRIFPQATLDSRKFEVEIEVSNSSGLLRPGFFVNAVISPSDGSGKPSDGVHRTITVVPRLAVIVRHRQPYCFTVVRDEGSPEAPATARWTPIETRPLPNDPQFVQVVSGVQPGQYVVTSGLQHLSDGAPVQVRE